MQGQRIAAVHGFLTDFCAGDLAALAARLHPDLRLRGPLYRFDSRAAYLASLRDDPPPAATFEVLHLCADDDAVSVYYTYRRAAGELTIAQLFRFDGQLIAETLLVFDTAALR